MALTVVRAGPTVWCSSTAASVILHSPGPEWGVGPDLVAGIQAWAPPSSREETRRNPRIRRKNLSGHSLGLLHTIRRMLEASDGRSQSHADVNSDTLLKVVPGSDCASISRIMVT